MRLSPDIDLSKSLYRIFADKAQHNSQVQQDGARQAATAEAILNRFFTDDDSERREMLILADEVGLGKTYVALAVAVSILHSIRRGEAHPELPSNQPVVMVLTPNNEALYRKWFREAENFKVECAATPGALDWLQISPGREDRKSSNIIGLTRQIRHARRNKPMLLIAKNSVFGARLNDTDLWRKRSLATLFRFYNVPTDLRRRWCRKGQAFETLGIPELPELLDLRRARPAGKIQELPDLEKAFMRALQAHGEACRRALHGSDAAEFRNELDRLARCALTSSWPQMPLVIFDEIHGLKNKAVTPRKNFEVFAGNRVRRILGLSATPFQLRHGELLSLLELQKVLSVPGARHLALDQAASALEGTMKAARDAGEEFRSRWQDLRPGDEQGVHEGWKRVAAAAPMEQEQVARQIRPPGVALVLSAALRLETCNKKLSRDLRPFVIRHRHPRGYREHYVGRNVALSGGQGSPNFSWHPGMDIGGESELAQYLMMRAVELARAEKREGEELGGKARGLPGLGAELTGSYRHLTETSAVWKTLKGAKNPDLRAYSDILQQIIGTCTEDHDPDSEHPKIQATVARAMKFFRLGQKSLIFCVYIKTAEALRDQLDAAVKADLDRKKSDVFESDQKFVNFRRRFFNRREPLFSLIQDNPLLGTLRGNKPGIPQEIALSVEHLKQVARILVERGESPDTDKPDLRLLLAATEHVAVNYWRNLPEGRSWLTKVLGGCKDLEDTMRSPQWLDAREPLSRKGPPGHPGLSSEPEVLGLSGDPLELDDLAGDASPRLTNEAPQEAIAAWARRLRKDAVGAVVAPYFRTGLVDYAAGQHPLLAHHHRELLAKLDLETRTLAGHVFRRILMAEQFLLRYLADVEKERAERWADYLAERYTKPLGGHLESLCDRVTTYFETLAGAAKNESLLAGYRAGAENRNIVQLVKGDTADRDRYFLGFNTPYNPEILVSTQVGQEGIDLHKECRHVIHHDLCWNPATIEQRTGRVDRIGSKVERERNAA